MYNLADIESRLPRFAKPCQPLAGTRHPLNPRFSLTSLTSLTPKPLKNHIAHIFFVEKTRSEESFKAANATQSEIRKRLFHAVNDPTSDYHEIRWLIKSLEMLRA
jgi:hypothetical protein